MSVFLDTNILVYAIESAGPDPEALTRRTDVSLSTQVLGEFYRAVTSPRRKSPLTHSEAAEWIQVWKQYDVLAITLSHVNLALEICGKFQVGYYDALILSTARLASCGLVYSEDLNPGQDYGGVKVENPFAE